MDDSSIDEKDIYYLMIVSIDKENQLSEPLEGFERYQPDFPDKLGNLNLKAGDTSSEEEAVGGDRKDKRLSIANRSDEDED
jgi:hypothetical protein